MFLSVDCKDYYLDDELVARLNMLWERAGQDVGSAVFAKGSDELCQDSEQRLQRLYYLIIIRQQTPSVIPDSMLRDSKIEMSVIYALVKKVHKQRALREGAFLPSYARLTAV